MKKNKKRPAFAGLFFIMKLIYFDI